MRQFFIYNDVIISMILLSLLLPLYGCLMIETNIRNQKLAFIFGLIIAGFTNFILFYQITHSTFVINFWRH